MMLLLLEMNFVIRINVVPLTAGCLVLARRRVDTRISGILRTLDPS